MKRYRNYLLLCLLLGPISVFAQNNGTIVGKVTEASPTKPLEFVTLVLMKQDSQQLIKQEVTDSKGQYKITGIADGTYYLIASYIGFDKLKTNNFVISTGGVKKQIQKGKGELFLNGTDILGTLKTKRSIIGNGFIYNSTDYLETQVFRLGYSYKF
ncbi:MAG: TonB-dependent receptor [Pedobacter sp.]|nr:TonB-dependent receptor [Pedobacter sp.]